MKLLVCDVEGTIFTIDDLNGEAKHKSFIWTAIAKKIGLEAIKRELEMGQKWEKGGENGGYGEKNGENYLEWVRDTYKMHKELALTEDMFNAAIYEASYIKGVESFFEKLDRNEYIPILISGGIQNFSLRACYELGIKEEDSFASCKYCFNKKGLLDDVIFPDTTNFSGKYEFVQIMLDKYSLNDNDWIFIGDGENDISVAKKAHLAIGIDPVQGLRDLPNIYCVENFIEIEKNLGKWIEEKIKTIDLIYR